MSSDKRRRARVQGAGWASTPHSTRGTPAKKPEGSQPAVQNTPSWLGRTVDQPSDTSKRFIYQEPAEEIKQKPEERLITKMGVYDISLEPSGVSRMRFFPNFMDAEEAMNMFELLFHELPWKQRSDVKDGVEYLQPRLTTWFGDLSYSYSGLTHDANSQWHPILSTLKDRLEDNVGIRFNSVLANLYRDNRDHVPWHADDEPALRKNPTIASISLGDLRNFELRKNPPPELAGDYSLSEHVRVPLSNGSLLIMEGCTQEDWKHRVSKEYHERHPRINLTFRVIYPE